MGFIFTDEYDRGSLVTLIPFFFSVGCGWPASPTFLFGVISLPVLQRTTSVFNLVESPLLSTAPLSHLPLPLPGVPVPCPSQLILTHLSQLSPRVNSPVAFPELSSTSTYLFEEKPRPDLVPHTR